MLLLEIRVESNLGTAMVVVAIIMEIIGYLIIRKIVNIKF